jgi:hypothetical protein
MKFVQNTSTNRTIFHGLTDTTVSISGYAASNFRILVSDEFGRIWKNLFPSVYVAISVFTWKERKLT